MKRILIVLVFYLGLISCSEDPNPSLWDEDLLDPNYNSNPQPVIEQILPEGSAFAGVGNLEIIGQNFSETAEYNVVYFDDVVATVLEASTTRLLIATPNLPKDKILVKIAVRGAQLFSDIVKANGDTLFYNLKPAVQLTGTLLADEVVYGTAVGPDETIYIYIDGKKLKKITPAGETLIISEEMPFDRSRSLRYGPDGFLYGAITAGRVKAVYTFDANDGTASVFSSVPQNPEDLDFDASGNIWVVGKSDLMFVASDGSSSQAVLTTDAEELTAVRIFNNFVYFAGYNLTSGLQKIWKAEIQGTTVGEPEEVIDVTATPEFAQSIVRSLTFSDEGKMFIALETEDALKEDALYVYDESSGNLEIQYPKLINPDIFRVVWGTGDFLYAIRHFNAGGSSEILKIDLGRSGAPYYGRP